MINGIYSIENLVNSKKYIGQSINLNRRKTMHFCYLKNNSHTNSHLQKAFNKYGRDNFSFNILIYCEAFELVKYEQFFVNININNIYNIRKESVKSSLGLKFSEDHKKKISEKLSGKNNPMYGKKGNLSPNFGKESKIKGEKHPLYGKHRSAEEKQKISEKLKGRKLSNETKYKISEKLKGSVFSEERNKKISNSRKGMVFSKEHKKNISKSKKGVFSGKNNPMWGKESAFHGKKHKQETKEKMSLIRKEYWRKKHEEKQENISASS